MPYRVPIHTIVGRPIHVPKIDNPTQEQITTLHEKYINELKNLFEQNKTIFLKNLDTSLEIV